MFTEEEIKMIFDALDALETKESKDNLMVTIFGAVLAPDSEARKEFLDEQKQQLKEQEVNHQILKERIILLKAKLIQMKDRAFIKGLD